MARNTTAEVETTEVQDTATTNLTDEQIAIAQEWSTAKDALDAGVPEGSELTLRDLRKTEDAARVSLWNAVNRNRELFDEALAYVGKPRAPREIEKDVPKAPKAPKAKKEKQPKATMVGGKKREWNPAVGESVNLKIFTFPEVMIPATIVGLERYGRFYAFTPDYGRVMIGKSRLYPIRDAEGNSTMVDLETLPAEALTPREGEHAASEASAAEGESESES